MAYHGQREIQHLSIEEMCIDIKSIVFMFLHLLYGHSRSSLEVPRLS